MADNSELVRLHERIDELMRMQTNMQVSIARIEEKMPKQPCPALTAHLEKHKQGEERFWSIASKWLTPTAIIAAAWALFKTYYKGE